MTPSFPAITLGWEAKDNTEGNPVDNPWIKLGVVVGVFALLTAARYFGVDDLKTILAEATPK